MSEKKKKHDKGNNNIPFHNLFDYSDTIVDFSEYERLSESELEQQLPCFSEYEPECKLNSLMDSHLNDHLYGVYSSKHTETVSFLRTWTGFFVRQYRTKISQRVKPYLDSQKLSLDDWLMSVKQGQRGDIMLVYICHGLKIRVFYFLYIFQTFQMTQISFMAAQVNAVLLIPLFFMRD